MADYIAFDTSNYTTSVAVLKDGIPYSERRILPVPAGDRGLRQSDAVFLHTKALHDITAELMKKCGDIKINAVGYSDRPRDTDGSYMPCFLVGENAAKTLASVLNVPSFAFSHQAGHIMAGIYSCGAPEEFEKRFLFFHVSGGTTEALLVDRTDDGFKTKIIGNTADISVGQLIDRVGVMLGAGFPAGAELEKTALGFSGRIDRMLHIKPVIKDGALNLSGFENNALRAFENGISKEEIAFATLKFSAASLTCLSEYAKSAAGDIPSLYAGGVIRNEYIKSKLAADRVFFASCELSSDNAVGTVLMTAACASRRGK